MHQEPKLGLQNQHEQAPRVHKTVSRQKVQSAIYCQREIAFIFYTWKKKKIYLFKTVPSKLLSNASGPEVPHVLPAECLPLPRHVAFLSVVLAARAHHLKNKSAGSVLDAGKPAPLDSTRPGGWWFFKPRLPAPGRRGGLGPELGNPCFPGLKN